MKAECWPFLNVFFTGNYFQNILLLKEPRLFLETNQTKTQNLTNKKLKETQGAANLLHDTQRGVNCHISLISTTSLCLSSDYRGSLNSQFNVVPNADDSEYRLSGTETKTYCLKTAFLCNICASVVLPHMNPYCTNNHIFIGKKYIFNLDSREGLINKKKKKSHIDVFVSVLTWEEFSLLLLIVVISFNLGALLSQLCSFSEVATLLTFACVAFHATSFQESRVMQGDIMHFQIPSGKNWT